MTTPTGRIWIPQIFPQTFERKYSSYFHSRSWKISIKTNCNKFYSSRYKHSDFSAIIKSVIKCSLGRSWGMGKYHPFSLVAQKSQIIYYCLCLLMMSTKDFLLLRLLVSWISFDIDGKFMAVHRKKNIREMGRKDKWGEKWLRRW